MGLYELAQQCAGIAPAIVIAEALCAVILVDMMAPLNWSRFWGGIVSLVGIVAAVLTLLSQMAAGHAFYRAATFGDMLTHDQLSAFFQMLFLAGTAITVLFSMRSRETDGYRQGEYYCLLLGALLGAMLLASADHFLLFLLGLETLSLCSYVLAGSLKHERLSAEASLKYLIYGAVASGVMLFGISYVYGLTGTLSINKAMSMVVAQLTANQLGHLTFFLVLALLLAGLGFKIAMVPFHFWCPDVYQGAPTPITAFLSVVSKSAGFSALLRVMLPFFLVAKPDLTLNVRFFGLMELPVFFGLLSVVTMTFGNLVALRQTDVKRLLAYSSIAHAGYLLMGLTVYNRASIEAIFFYFFVYLFMNFGAFWVVIVLINRLGSSDIEKFRGAASKAPYLFAAMFIFLISLTGLPPTAGFVGKFMLFKVVIGAGLTQMTIAGLMTPMAVFYFAVALIGLLNSAISLYYYMKIARSMAFDKPLDDQPLGDDLGDRVYATLLAAPTLILLYFAPVLDFIRFAGR